MVEDASNLKFFNYHEISVPGVSNYVIIKTHFPNVYHPDTSETTRIVRIPLVQTQEYPQFSNRLPGHEDAAVLDPINRTSFKFTPVVRYQDQLYGYSSVSPLSLYLDEAEFGDIVDTINRKLQKAYTSPKYVYWNILDLLTLGLMRYILRWRFDKSEFDNIEEYESRLNDDFNKRGIPIRLISLRRSGYLSLDFEVPRPMVLESATTTIVD